MTLLFALLISLGTAFSTDYTTSSAGLESQEHTLHSNQNPSGIIENETSLLTYDVEGM